jgi:hypothetical protein
VLLIGTNPPRSAADRTRLRGLQRKGAKIFRIGPEADLGMVSGSAAISSFV